VTLGPLLWLVARGLGLALLGLLCLLLIPAHWGLDRASRGLAWLADCVVNFVVWVIHSFERWKQDARKAEVGR